MSAVAPPPGHTRNVALAERLAEIGHEIADQRNLLSVINDPDSRSLCEPLSRVLALGERLLTMHGGVAGADIAEELAGLLSLVRAVRLPARDAAGERSFSLDQLRGGQGRMVMALSDALDTARSLGLVPPEPTLPGGVPVEVPRAGNEEELRGIAASLDRVAEQLDALEVAKGEPSSIRQARPLIEFYVGAMRIQIDMARLQLTIGERGVDFAALSRAGQTMADLTGDFFATITAWAGNVVARVRDAARAAKRSVGQMTRRVGGAIRTILQRGRREFLNPSARERALDGRAPVADTREAAPADIAPYAAPHSPPHGIPLVFISYSPHDRSAGERLVKDLSEAAAIVTTRTMFSRVPDQVREIEASVHGSDFVIACLSATDWPGPRTLARLVAKARASRASEKPHMIAALIDPAVEALASLDDHALLNAFAVVDLYSDWDSGVRRIEALLSAGDSDFHRPERGPIENRPASDNPRSKASEGAAEIIAHLKSAGDVEGRFGEWIGDTRAIIDAVTERIGEGDGVRPNASGRKGWRMSPLWVEGIQLAPRWRLSDDDIFYQVIMLEPGSSAPLSSVTYSAGDYCGSRGLWQAIRGIWIALSARAAEQYDLSYSVIFSDGSRIGPVPSGTRCMTEKLDAVVAFRIDLTLR
jgi:hypothetical protein